MRFDEYGKAGHPVVIMLPGSFCPGKAMDYLYNRLTGYHVVVVTYNGHHENSGDFTSRQEEAAEICAHLTAQGITDIRMIYGQSMGAEVGMELYRQLTEQGITVQSLLFDGAPMTRLSVPYRAFMRFKFGKMVSMFRGKTADEAMHSPMVQNIVGNKVEQLRPMITAVCAVAPYLSKASIAHVVECCYTFDFPPLSEEMQQRTWFFYGTEEKAYKLCYLLVVKAYPHAHYRIEEGQGHVTYSCDHTDDYVAWMDEILGHSSMPAPCRSGAQGDRRAVRR